MQIPPRRPIYIVFADVLKDLENLCYALSNSLLFCTNVKEQRLLK